MIDCLMKKNCSKSRVLVRLMYHLLQHAKDYQEDPLRHHRNKDALFGHFPFLHI